MKRPPPLLPVGCGRLLETCGDGCSDRRPYHEPLRRLAVLRTHLLWISRGLGALEAAFTGKPTHSTVQFYRVLWTTP